MNPWWGGPLVSPGINIYLPYPNFFYIPGANMRNKSPATISAILTVLILVLLSILFLLLQMIALNGASERQGWTAMGISLGCQSLVIILLATVAARATTFLTTKVEWNSILAVVVTVLVAATIGGVISFLASIVAIPVAG